MSETRTNLPDYRDVLTGLEPITADPDPAKLSKIYGSRFNRAWELLKERAVKKYVFKSGMVRWIVAGKQRNYLVYPDVAFCSCEDFFFAVMRGEALVCQHLIAQTLAEKLSDYEVIEKKSVAPSEGTAEKGEVGLGGTTQMVRFWEGTGH